MIKCVSCLTETVKNAEFCHSCGAGVIDMVAYRAARDMAKDQPRTATARKVLANLSQRQAGRLKGLTKQAGRFLEDVPISSKTFPDQDTHRAAARLTDVLLDVMQFMRPLAEQTGDTEMLQIIDEVEQRVEMVAEPELEMEQPMDDGGGFPEETEEPKDVDLDDEMDNGKDVEIDEGGGY